MLVKKEVYFMCRTCLKIGTNYFSLFNYFEDGTALSDMLIECITRQAEEDDGLPSHICSECKTKLYSSWAFKSLALEAESKLRSNTKTLRRNEEPDIIKVETIVTSNDYNIDDAAQVQCSDPFIFRNYSVNELSTNNTEDSMCDENEMPKTYEEKSVIEYLGESQCKNEITGVNDNVRTYQNDLVECTTNVDSLEEKSFSCEVNIDNKMLTDTEEQENLSQYIENACINNRNKAAPKVRKLKNTLSRKLVRSKRNTKKEFNQHSKRNISRNEYNKSFMTEHQETEKSENHTNIFTCSSCNRSFRSRKSLRMHMTIKGPHIHEDRHICQICGIVFDTLNKLKYHKETHVNEPHECNICKKVFMSRSSLKAHIERHTQTPESKPICELCGKVYSNIFTLRKHYETHNTERTVPCPTCGKLFTNQNNMSAHLKFHTARETHICEYCNKGFKTANRKKRHVLIHTGEKPYPCKLCDKRFVDDGTLYRHMLTHTGETKFVCDKCPYKCRYKQQFDNHLKKHK